VIFSGNRIENGLTLPPPVAALAGVESESAPKFLMYVRVGKNISCLSKPLLTRRANSFA